MRMILWCVLVAWATVANAAPGMVTFDSAQFARLARAPIGATVEVAEFPVGPGVLAAVRFERIDIYAPDARIIEMTADGEREVPRSTHVQLIGTSTDGGTRIGLTLDAARGDVHFGAGSGPAGTFVVRSERTSAGLRLHALDAKAALPSGVVPEFVANDDTAIGVDEEPRLLEHLAGIDARAASPPARLAVVAVDTDTELMFERFSNNTGQAADWIASLFNQLNVFYRRDLDVILMQGTTLLRTASDPFNNTDSPASQAQLVEFGNWWQANQAAVPRAFAMLLSGKSPSGNSASGIAWLNRYCQNAGNNGSYSINQVFTNPGIGVASSAFLVGHELGHNFGAAHTHCTNITTGASPTPTNTIDQCFAGESGLGCYAGATSCPTSGPGAPLGTLMSYCHLRSPTCGQNVLQFHPTHVTLIRNRVAANTPGCLRSEVLFTHGFE